MKEDCDEKVFGGHFNDCDVGSRNVYRLFRRQGASYWSQYNDTMPALESLQDDEELMDVQTLKDASAFVDSYQIRPQLPGYMNYQIYTINSNVSAYLSGGRSIEDTISGLKDTSYLLD